MAIISQQELSDIREDIREVVADDTIATTITYRVTGSTVSDWDPTTGIIPAMYTESTVSAFKGGFSLDDIEQGGGLIEYEDVKFIIMTDDVSGVLSVDDMIREPQSLEQSSTTYQIKTVSRDPLDICYFVRVRKGSEKIL